MSISKSFVITLSFMIFSIIIGTLVYLVIERINVLSGYSYFLTSSIQFLAVLLYLKKVDKSVFTNPFKSEKKYYLLAAILGVLFVFIQQVLLRILYHLFNVNKSFQYDFDPSMLLESKSVALIMILPVVEEFLFRGYIQSGLQKRYNYLVAIIIASFLFSLIHFPISIFYFEYSDRAYSAVELFSQMYHTFFGGLFLGYLYYKSKSVGPPIVMHIVWNLIVTIT
jgi:membrane protease YdiL (CAAX protease family)